MNTLWEPLLSRRRLCKTTLAVFSAGLGPREVSRRGAREDIGARSAGFVWCLVVDAGGKAAPI